MIEGKYSLRERYTEWCISFGVLLWGVLVLFSPDLNTKPWFMTLASFAPMYVWGLFATFIGMTRLTFLVINGAIRRSAHMRAIGAALSIPIWVSLLVGTGANMPATPALGLYLICILLDGFSVWFATGDAKLADIRARKIRENGNK